MKNFILILTTCFMLLDSFGAKAKLDENLLLARNQPTTANLVTMSMAKLRNRDVSDWYAEKFIGNVIKFDSNMNGNLQDCFMENFNKIASNPVGRVLLFRILIETKIESNDTTRERLKQITIIEDAELGFGFHEDYGIISFTDTTTKPCVIKRKKHWFRETTYKLKEEKIDNIDINLFHEMCHWFHALHDRERKKKEGNVTDLFSNPLGRYYWGNIKEFESVIGKNKAKFTVYEDALFAYSGDGAISFEEIRTILGSNNEVEDYKEGDDLCENLYRFSKGALLRWGHKDKNIIEKFCENVYEPDKRLLYKVLTISKTNYYLYQ